MLDWRIAKQFEETAKVWMYSFWKTVVDDHAEEMVVTSATAEPSTIDSSFWSAIDEAVVRKRIRTVAAQDQLFQEQLFQKELEQYRHEKCHVSNENSLLHGNKLCKNSQKMPNLQKTYCVFLELLFPAREYGLMRVT